MIYKLGYNSIYIYMQYIYIYRGYIIPFLTVKGHNCDERVDHQLNGCTRTSGEALGMEPSSPTPTAMGRNRGRGASATATGH